MNILPQKPEVITFETYEELCKLFKNKFLHIEGDYDYKLQFKNSLLFVHSEDNNFTDEDIRNLNIELLKCLQVPYVQKNEHLGIPDSIRLEINFRVMSLLQAIDELSIKSYLTDFIHHQLLKVVDHADEWFESYNELTIAEIKPRLVFDMGLTFDDWEVESGECYSLKIKPLFNIGSANNEILEFDDNISKKTLFYIYDHLGIIDFLGKSLLYKKSEGNTMQLSQNTQAMARVLNILMNLDSDNDTNRRYIGDRFNPNKSYGEDTKTKAEELLKKLKIVSNSEQSSI